MVRVITVHNFLGQNVAQIEEPTATCVVSMSNKEMFLLALPSHCVEVWELSTSSNQLHNVFPSVDMICQMQHCVQGDYIVTLESKVLRDGATINCTSKMHNFVRIYVNWSMVKESNQPMHARIAGRVTPSLNRPLNGLEMIELPLNTQPTLVTCCQCTGNLLVATGNTAILHEFKIETQQLSKLKFIDFEARPWSLSFSFTPTYMAMIEDFIAIMDSSSLSVFRLTNTMYEDIDQLSSIASTNSSLIDKTSISTDSSLIDNSHDNISVHQTNSSNLKNDDEILQSNDASLIDIKIKKRRKSSKANSWIKTDGLEVNKRRVCNNRSMIDLDYLIWNEEEELKRLINQEIILPDSQPLTINLPSISLERVGPGHALSPFILNPPDLTVLIKTNSPDNGWSENYSIRYLLRLKISSISNNAKIDGNSEIFTSLVLKPLYMRKECNNYLKKSILRSSRYNHLQGVSCFICTMQEGYLYHFSAGNSCTDTTCLTTYPFTAPVHQVALEYSAIHALTEAGLESYTLRLSHHIAKSASMDIDHLKVPCPSISEPVCLIGLRPFLGIEKLLHTRNYIVLLAKAENSWTLYSLTLPKLENFYYDLLNAAKSYKSTSPNTYRHLLSEAHALIRLAKDMIHQSIDQDNCDDEKSKDEARLKNLYNQSCALLADYYIRSECESDWDLCVPYYKMSGLKPVEVLSRKSSQDAPGLITYLADMLLTMRSGPETDSLFQSHNIVKTICRLEKKDQLQLIFSSAILREYATEKLIQLLLPHPQCDDEIRLALALLYIQSEKQEKAEKIMEEISEGSIRTILVNHWDLLFDSTAVRKKSRMIPTFSDFAGILMCNKHSTFADILIEIIEGERILSLHLVIQVFLEYLPSRVGRDGHRAASTLQIFLERFLQNHFSIRLMTDPASLNKHLIYSDTAMVEAFKLLVRSYLSKLSKSKICKTIIKSNCVEEEIFESYIFSKNRPNYLNQMPPYANDYQKILSADDLNDLADINKSPCKKLIPKELFKLQCLLACEFLPVECFHEVEHFMETQEVDGSLSLKTLCIQNTEEVTTILIENSPQAVVQYAKEKYTKDSEWKYLIEILQNKISTSNAQQALHCLYTHMMKEILAYLPRALSLKSLHRILSKEDKAVFQKCTEVCTQIMHADHVKSLIMETGQQLLTTLKL
ncbi:BLOC-2 complex member HPS3 [Prorops nasuta]|uniref:BLOC-2 complex member HPS3 n=1 Tax=Prorops nasuta TaxID=863751 RepID=UPI0034CFF704